MLLLLFEIDGFEGVFFDGVADLGRSLSESSLLVGEDCFLGAGGALGAVQALKTAAQAGVSQGAVAPAIAGELIEHISDMGGLLIDVELPGILERRLG